MNPKNFDITTLFKRMSLDQLQAMRKNMVDQLSALDKYISEHYPAMRKNMVDQLSALDKYISEHYPDLPSQEVTQ